MAGDNETLAILVKSLSNLLKKDVISKPTIFSPSAMSVSCHLDSIKTYCLFIESTSDIEMALVLWDTFDDSIKNEIIFDPDYDNKKESFKWLGEKLKKMFPAVSNKTTDLIELNQIKQNNRNFYAL